MWWDYWNLLLCLHEQIVYYFVHLCSFHVFKLHVYKTFVTYVTRKIYMNSTTNHVFFKTILGKKVKNKESQVEEK